MQEELNEIKLKMIDNLNNVKTIKELNDLKVLYQGKKGKEYCENDISEEDSCEVVVTNDKTFWGYGLKKGEAAN